MPGARKNEKTAREHKEDADAPIYYSLFMLKMLHWLIIVRTFLYAIYHYFYVDVNENQNGKG